MRERSKLSALDAGFLEAEDADSHVSMAIAALAIVEGRAPDTASFTSSIATRIDGVPRYRQVLRSHGLDATAPEWVPDDDFHIEHHIRRIGVPEPHDERALFGVVANVMERRLDRNRPLWECWVVDGLSGDRWAVVMKIHHCMADGIAAGAMLAGLCDTATDHPTTSGPGPTDATVATDVCHSERADQAIDSRVPSLNPLDWLAGGANLSRDAIRATIRVVTGAAQIAVGIATAAPQPITGPLTDRRRYAAATVSMSDVRSVCERFDVTVYDVALAAITDGVRMAMLDRSHQIGADSLRTLVPVSLRKADQLHTPDNRVSVMLPLLPVDLSDPLQRLQAVHDRLDVAKASGQRSAGSLLTSISELLPFAITSRTVRLLARLPQHGVVTVATNVPGPRHPQMLMGACVLTVLPVPPIAVHLRLGIAISSYVDDLSFGLIGDFDSPLDVDELAAGIAAGVDRLVRLAAAAKKSKRLGALLLLIS